MKNLLETVIKTALFEKQSVGKIQRIALSQDEMQQAKSSGAVFAYKVITRNAPNDKDRLNLVRGATLASVAGDATRVAVGASSKFADGNYVYVIDPAVGDGNRQVSLVRIFLELPKNLKDTDTETDPNNITVNVLHPMIGLSRIIPLSSYDAERAIQKQPKIDAVDIDKNVFDKIADKTADIINKSNSEEPKTQSDNSVDNKTKTPTDGYPFEWKVNNNTYMVYTMAPTDPYVYIKDDNSVWYYLKKVDFESNYTNSEKIDSLTKPLNKAGIAKVEKAFGLSTNNTQDQGDQDQGNQDQGNQDTAKIKSGSVVNFKGKIGDDIPLYVYKQGKFTQSTRTFKIDNKTKITYLGKSKYGNGRMSRVQFGSDSNDVYWVKTDILQEMDSIRGGVTQVGGTINGLTVTENGKTRAIKKGDMIKVPSTKLYTYNSETKKWYHSGYSWTDNGKSKMIIGQSSNKQWIFVNFGGGDKYWVPASLWLKK